MPTTCIVVGCGSRSNREKVSFFAVPTILKNKFLVHKNELSKRRRERWLAAISRGDLSESKLRYQAVCSKHFVRGKPAALEDENHPDWVPTQFMGHKSVAVARKCSDVERTDRLENRRKVQLANFTPSRAPSEHHASVGNDEATPSLQEIPILEHVLNESSAPQIQCTVINTQAEVESEEFTNKAIVDGIINESDVFYPVPKDEVSAAEIENPQKNKRLEKLPRTLNISNVSAIILSDDDSELSITEMPRMKCLCRLTFLDPSISVTICSKCAEYYHTPCIGYLERKSVVKPFVCVRCRDGCTDTLLLNVKQSDYKKLAISRLVIALVKQNSKLPSTFKKQLNSAQRDEVYDQMIQLEILKEEHGSLSYNSERADFMMRQLYCQNHDSYLLI